jgi:hypothetical protein
LISGLIIVALGPLFSFPLQLRKASRRIKGEEDIKVITSTFPSSMNTDYYHNLWYPP